MVTTSEVPQDRTFVATVDAAGAATITVLTWGKPWLVSQVSTEMPTAPTGAVCALRKRGNLITPMIAAGDAAGGDPPVTLYPGEPMTIEWTACTPGDQGKATVIYQLVEYG
jgi:hypothetical protein